MQALKSNPGFSSGQVTSVRAALSGRQAFTSSRFTLQGLSVQRLTRPTPGRCPKPQAALEPAARAAPEAGRAGGQRVLVSPRSRHYRPPGRA